MVIISFIIFFFLVRERREHKNQTNSTTENIKESK